MSGAGKGGTSRQLCNATSCAIRCEFSAAFLVPNQHTESSAWSYTRANTHTRSASARAPASCDDVDDGGGGDDVGTLLARVCDGGARTRLCASQRRHSQASVSREHGRCARNETKPNLHYTTVDRANSVCASSSWVCVCEPAASALFDWSHIHRHKQTPTHPHTHTHRAHLLQW